MALINMSSEIKTLLEGKSPAGTLLSPVLLEGGDMNVRRNYKTIISASFYFSIDGRSCHILESLRVI